MRGYRFSVAVLGVSLTGWAASASAAVLNVDFNGAQDTYQGGAPGPTAVGAGPAINDGFGGSSDYWNAANDATNTGSGSVSSLTYSDGATVSGVGLTWSAGDSWDVGPATNSPNVNLTKDFLFNSGTVTLTNVPANGSYTLYVVSINDNDSGSRPSAITLTDGATTSIASQTSAGNYGNAAGPSGVWTAGQQYVRFDSVTPGLDGNIAFTFSGGGVGTVNGLQLVTPEPASLGLLGLAAVGLLRRRPQSRRR